MMLLLTLMSIDVQINLRMTKNVIAPVLTDAGASD